VAREIEVAVRCERVSDVSVNGVDRLLNLFPQTTVFIEGRVDRQLSYCTSELPSELENNGPCTAGTRHS